MFQHPSLLPWRTIAGNVRYGMEMQKRFDEATMQERAGHFLKLVGLSGFEKHFPASCPAACSSASTSRARWRPIRSCC